MTLEEALAFAHREHPRMRAERARIASAQEQAREPGAAWKPRFGATIQAVGSSNNNSATNWLGTRGAVEFPRIAGTGFLQEPKEINWKPYMSTAVGVSGEQRLFDFGRVAAETAAADARVAVEHARLEDEWLAVELGIRETYYAVMSARGILDVARDAVIRARIHRDDARARVAQGMRARIDIERPEADLARFEVNLLRSEGALRDAQAAFAAAVGVPSPLLDVSSSGARVPSPVPPLGAILDDAARNDPAIRLAVLRAKAAHARVTATGAQSRPEVWLIGTVNSAAGGAPREAPKSDQTWGRGFVPWVPDYFAGIVFAWRFYDPVVDARTDSARREEDVANAEVGVVQRERVALIERVWMALQVASAALPALERAVAAARANHQQAETRFASGMGTAVELADAEALRISAEIELEQGRFEVGRASARLSSITGGHP